MPVFRPYIPFFCPQPHCGSPDLEITPQALDMLARQSLALPASPDDCSPYAEALSTRFASRFTGDLQNAATVLVIVLVEALHTGGRLPRAVRLWEVRVLVMGVVGRLRCFSAPSAALLLDLLGQFWKFLAELWAVPSLEAILDYLAHPTTITALGGQLEKTAREPSLSPLGEALLLEGHRSPSADAEKPRSPPGTDPVEPQGAAA